MPLPDTAAGQHGYPAADGKRAFPWKRPAHDEMGSRLTATGVRLCTASTTSTKAIRVLCESRTGGSTIAGIRRRQDAGELTLCEAADERIQIMAAHLQALQEAKAPVPGRGLTAPRAHASASLASVNAENPPVCTVTGDIRLIGRYPESTLVAVKSELIWLTCKKTVNR